MIDPMTSLAFGVYSNPGVYALLLGSGISSAAKIPTGWDIVVDLVAKYANLLGEDVKGDPVGWYTKHTGTPPDYSTLIEQIAKTPAERRALLERYFEPTADERSQGAKLPSRAHLAIAELVATGFVRVILTTNFDRLMESALGAAGVSPIVISNEHAIRGAPPLEHSRCTVVKLHGDYLDTRIKNTPKELESYEPELNKLLDEVTDRYGLIVCGWSAVWDVALRDAISQQKNRRYSLYWMARSPLKGPASDLLAAAQGQLVQSKDADSFFDELAKKVHGLSALGETRHPITPALAVATAKAYISEGRRIELYDMVTELCEALYKEVAESNFPAQPTPFANEELLRRIELYQHHTSLMQSVLIIGGYWGSEEDARLWAAKLERIANPVGYQNGLIAWINLRRFPALLLLYSCGLAAIAGEKMRTLSLLFSSPRVEVRGKKVPAIAALHPGAVLDQQLGWRLPGKDRRHTPLSDHLFEILREPLRRFLPADQDYQDSFDKLEYLLGLSYMGLHKDMEWAPVGRFVWRDQHLEEMPPVVKGVAAEATRYGDSWPFFSPELFGTSAAFTDVKTKYDALVKQVRNQLL